MKKDPGSSCNSLSGNEGKRDGDKEREILLTARGIKDVL